MNLSSRMVVVLTSVGLLSGGFLASVGMLTKDRILLNKKRAIEQAVTVVVPGTEFSRMIFEEKDFEVYLCQDGAGQPQGYAVHTSGIGFQDKIDLMFGTDPNLANIFSLAVLDQKETPGLGAKITDKEAFLIFWEKRECLQPLELHKPAASSPEALAVSEVNTITGATISSQAVLDIVNRALEKMRSLKKEGKIEGKG